ncbi:MAG TPA: substrate-binding domain-containing protein [Candidatus Binatia bacterium]|nr:substrate-binding domain-containing protein [Candidatus Binatia bacterium]
MAGKVGQGHGRRAAWVLVAGTALVAAACGSTSAPSSSSSSAAATPTPSSAATAPSVPSVDVTTFTSDIGATMSQFKAFTQYATKGADSLQVGVILPDTTSSTRYVDFDAPYLTTAFGDAGYTQAQFKIDNAQGNDGTEIADAQADLALGAKVLVMDPLDGTTGDAIQSLVAAHPGVQLISYDRATFQGTSTYYVSFDNEKVGELIGKGEQACIQSWGISTPMIYELDGGVDTDPNAISFASGYNNILWGQEKQGLAAGTTNSGATLLKEDYAAGWNNTTGGTVFQSFYEANKSKVNATVEANDGLANAVITDLKGDGVAAKTIPTTGQDATLQGMENILTNWQCGSVYKPIYLEAQDAVALATILLGGGTPPAALLNGKTTDPANASITEPASLLTATWVNASNMESTVIKDGFISASTLCTAVGASICSAAGIS